MSRIGRLILPADPAVRLRRLELTIWAFLLSLAYYPGFLGFIAWFALVRPLIIISRLRGGAAFRSAYLFSFLFNLFSLYWVALVTPPGMVTAVVIVAFYYTAILMAFHRLYRIRPLLGFILLPFLWVGMEYFRTLSEFAFPWSDLGYTQSYYLYIIQIVSVVSVHGLSLLIVVVNLLIWQVFRAALSVERRIAAGSIAVGIVLLLIAYGWADLPKYPLDGNYKVALLQGSVPLEVKWAEGNEEHSLRLYDSLTRSVADKTINLYVWPETSAPCYVSHNRNCRNRLGEIVRASGGYHLVGALGATFEGQAVKHYNSCYQFDPDGVMGARYDKVRLVPFSEHVPYQDHLPFLKRDFLRQYLSFLDQPGIRWWSDFYPGDSMLLFELPDTWYGVLICFESTFPEYARRMVLEGAGFLIGITNDTWFGRSVGIHMHSRIFLTRAIENRCWSVRVANSGLTYVVDGYGRIRDRIGLYEVAAISSSVRLLEGYSVYTRIGDVAGRVSFLITIVTLGILVLLWIGKRALGRSISMR